MNCGILRWPGATSIRCVHRIVSAQEYRDQAQECVGWARSACTERERDIFLQMARTWLEAAERATKRDAEAISAIKGALDAPATGPKQGRQRFELPDDG